MEPMLELTHWPWAKQRWEKSTGTWSVPPLGSDRCEW